MGGERAVATPSPPQPSAFIRRRRRRQIKRKRVSRSALVAVLLLVVVVVWAVGRSVTLTRNVLAQPRSATAGIFRVVFSTALAMIIVLFVRRDSDVDCVCACDFRDYN